MLVLYFKGKAKDVFQEWRLRCQLAGPRLTIGELARLQELRGRKSK